MTRQSRRQGLNKEAFNTLTELYFSFLHLVEYRCNSKVSKREFDIFYFRGIDNVGGLKPAISTAFEASNLDPIVLGTRENPLTLDRLLPYETINSYISDERVQPVQDAYAALKSYYDREYDGSVGTDDAGMIVRDKAEEILRRCRLQDSSGSMDTQVDLSTAHIAHESHRLLIGHVRILLQANSIMDLATNYMVNEVRKGNTASSVSLAEWVTNNEAYMRAPTDSRGIKHALNDVNDLVKQKTEAAEELFDTSPRNGVIRNY